MSEPGLDRHEWESTFESIEPDLRDSPGEALPDFADLVERMLRERGFDLEEAVTAGGDEFEVVREYTSAREVSDRLERGERVDPGDVGAAVIGLRAVYDTLIVERGTP